MNAAAAAPLEQALALSTDMLAASEAGDWEQVQVLDRKLTRCLTQVDMAVPQPRTTVARLADNTRRLLTRAANARSEVETQLGQHAHNHRALKAYVSTSG